MGTLDFPCPRNETARPAEPVGLARNHERIPAKCPSEDERAPRARCMNSPQGCSLSRQRPPTQCNGAPMQRQCRIKTQYASGIHPARLQACQQHAGQLQHQQEHQRCQVHTADQGHHAAHGLQPGRNQAVGGLKTGRAGLHPGHQGIHQHQGAERGHQQLQQPHQADQGQQAQLTMTTGQQPQQHVL